MVAGHIGDIGADAHVVDAERCGAERDKLGAGLQTKEQELAQATERARRNTWALPQALVPPLPR